MEREQGRSCVLCILLSFSRLTSVCIPFKISAVPEEIVELIVNYSQCRCTSVLISLLRSLQFGLSLSFVQLKQDLCALCWAPQSQLGLGRLRTFVFSSLKNARIHHALGKSFLKTGCWSRQHLLALAAALFSSLQ